MKKEGVMKEVSKKDFTEIMSNTTDVYIEPDILELISDDSEIKEIYLRFDNTGFFKEEPLPTELYCNGDKLIAVITNKCELINSIKDLDQSIKDYLFDEKLGGYSEEDKFNIYQRQRKNIENQTKGLLKIDYDNLEERVTQLKIEFGE